MHRLRIYIAIALVLFTTCVGLSRIVSDEIGVSATASVSSFLDGSLDSNETHQIHQLQVLFNFAEGSSNGGVPLHISHRDRRHITSGY
jgi:hypothetical protein